MRRHPTNPRARRRGTTPATRTTADRLAFPRTWEDARRAAVVVSAVVSALRLIWGADIGRMLDAP